MKKLLFLAFMPVIILASELPQIKKVIKKTFRKGINPVTYPKLNLRDTASLRQQKISNADGEHSTLPSTAEIIAESNRLLRAMALQNLIENTPWEPIHIPEKYKIESTTK